MATVISKDGTQIAFDKIGKGEPVILVDGALCSRAFGPLPKLAELLSQHFTVINYDRRGRNESGDTSPYSVQGEIEDIDALIKEAGGSAYLAGVSSGAALALKATAAGLNVKKLVMFEPPFVNGENGHHAPIDSEEQLRKLINAGNRGGAVKFFMKDMVGLPSIAVFIMGLLPIFSKLKSVAHTLPYDAAVMSDFHLPLDLAARINIPTLAMSGSKSPASMQKAIEKLAKAIPGAQYKVLAGQNHNASPKSLAPVFTEFFNS